MALDMKGTDSEGATSKHTLDKEGFHVVVDVVFSRESIIVKMPNANKLMAQSTAKVDIAIQITSGNVKVTTNAGASAKKVRGIDGLNKRLYITNAASGSVLDGHTYTRALTENLAENVIESVIREQSLDNEDEIGSSLVNVGSVAKNYVLGMNVNKMIINGSIQNAYMSDEQCKMFCNTVVLDDAQDTHAPACGAQVTDL
ncbi:PREDICTED: uncharacterized protein LOC106126212 [Papilio xuthus]|uniref:Uncharacterized protein LOC106126212 n=1 Tax=Papilio xuthus TaxID=66420 RepID=A0AAJ6ZU83_PAPXU|nr:PREDICTED: uncharacterized protein LOC106126212 [Papilio xuthus]